MARRGLFQSEQSFRLALPIFILLYLVVQIPDAKALIFKGAGLSTDDAMRLVQVRDLLAGQRWFDLFQHRVLPPDGLSMHWSRYIDAPMAAIVWVLRPFVGLDMAGRLLAVIWPLTLGVTFILLTANLTRKLYGLQAAFLTLLVIPAYDLLAGAGFGVGATDHHAVQIILMLGVFGMITLPDRPSLRGAIGGALAALSLAIGLEMILFVALAGGVLVVVHSLGRQGSAQRLTGFSASLALCAPVLMAGQLDPALWGVPVCDALSPPLLAVTSAAFLASGTLVLAGRWISSPVARGALTLGVGAVAAVVLLPAIQPCLAGPYTAMSAEIQRSVLARIQEIRPAGYYFATDWARVIALLMPFYATTLLFAGFVVAKRGQGLVLLCFVVMPALLSFWQLRMLNMGLPLLAAAFGAGGAWAMNHSRTAIRLGGIAVLLCVLLSKPMAVGYLKASWNGTGPAKGKAALSDQCSEIDQLSQLDTVPAGIIFNPLNLGPLVLLASHHSVTAAPYHRSADAFSNGLLPFEGTQADLRAAVDRTKADYVLVCKGDKHGQENSIGSLLSKGGKMPWLVDVPFDKAQFRLLRVVR